MVCARDNACYDPAYVRAVHIDWTVRGQAASTTTCDPAWHLTLSVTAGARSPELAWAPVVCEQGRFTIDIIPRTYAAVALGDPAIGTSRATIDPTSGDARLDLGR